LSPATSAISDSSCLSSTSSSRQCPQMFHPYVVVSLLTGARTEELHALRWEYVHLEGYPNSVPPAPPFMQGWRSVRKGGETKTRKSRRTLALPARCLDALRNQRVQQVADQLRRGSAGTSPAWCSQLRSGPRWMLRMCAATSDALSAWSPASIRWSGRRASCGTRSSRCVGCGRPDRRELAAGRAQRNVGDRVGVPAPDQAGDPDRGERDGRSVRREGPQGSRRVVTQLDTHSATGGDRASANLALTRGLAGRGDRI
jgi:hypothetical protein